MLLFQRSHCFLNTQDCKSKVCFDYEGLILNPAFTDDI